MYFWNSHIPVVWVYRRTQAAHGVPAVPSGYTANALNQYTSRTVPGTLPLTGDAPLDVNVYVNDAFFVATMVKEQSWVRDPSANILVHEQLHLHIVEKTAALGTTEAREIIGKGVSCTDTSAKWYARDNWDSQFKALNDKVLEKSNALNDRYDAETDHNKNSDQQSKWNDKFEEFVDEFWK